MAQLPLYDVRELIRQYFHACRKDEKKFNDCVFAKLGWKKNIPGSPEGEPQIFEKKNPIYTRVQK